MKLTGKIVKRDDEKFLVFGWFNVSKDKDGNLVVDSQGDSISIEELEQAAYNFVLNSRVGGEMHETFGVARLVESMVFTKDKLKMLGLPEDSLPEGWFGGFKVTDTEVWQKIKNGDYKSFSIGGRAIREAIANE